MKKTISFFLCALLTLLSSLPLTAFAQEDIIRVACCGDSITQGWASTDLGSRSYPAQLQTLLDGTKYDVRNFGSGGLTAMKDYGDLVGSYWSYQNYYADSKNFQPDVVILMLGTNDAVVKEDGTYRTDLDAQYRADLKALVESFQGLDSKPTVYLCTPMTAFDDAHPARVQGIVVPAVKDVATATGATLVDVNAHTVNYKADGLTDDGIHPNDAGYLDMAKFFYTTLFGGTVSKLTVTTEPGNTVSLGGQQVTADGEGKAVLDAGQGEKTLRIGKENVGNSDLSVTVKGDTFADCTGLVIDRNLALAATPLDSMNAAKANLNDNDPSTGWQPAMGASYADMWAGLDFTADTAVNTVEIQWEVATRCPEGGYKVQVSSDGENWVDPAGIVYSYGEGADRVTFEDVSTRFVRVKCESGSNNVWKPQIFELRVFHAGTLFTPVVTYASEDGKTSDSDEEPTPTPSIWPYLLVSAGVVVVAGLAAAFTASRQNKSGNGRNTIS